MISRRQYSPRLLKFYELMFELMYERDVRQREEMKNMPDDDLEGLVKSQINELIRQEPQLAVDAAQKLGWTVIPTASCGTV